jgi:putative Mg2+ transporter-C (MgtC) family protein
MIFSYLSAHVDPNSTSRIDAQIITGIGFLGAGLILRSEETKRVTNLTTAARFSCSIGMAFGFGFHFIGIVAVVFAIFVARIPKIPKLGIAMTVMYNKIWD